MLSNYFNQIGWWTSKVSTLDYYASIFLCSYWLRTCYSYLDFQNSSSHLMANYCRRRTSLSSTGQFSLGSFSWLSLISLRLAFSLAFYSSSFTNCRWIIYFSAIILACYSNSLVYSSECLTIAVHMLWRSKRASFCSSTSSSFSSLFRSNGLLIFSWLMSMKLSYSDFRLLREVAMYLQR